MRRSPFLALLAFAVMAAPASANTIPEGATWSEATIESTDGVKLHADILRPSNLPGDAKTPVILSIGPYFNHAGEVGAAGPAEDADYDPLGPSAGPSGRFYDFVEGAHLMERGYTFVMVDLRGFGGSTGCLDWGGPGEQSDVVKAVEWAANADGNGLQTSSGAVGMYGKSYDGVTGLIGVNHAPEGLKAVVAQEPVYDLYRYLYGDGIRRANSLLTPTLYDAIAGTPGPLGDGPEYVAPSVNTPDCLALNVASQGLDDDHQSDFWKQRDLIPGAKGSNVPLFLTQGLTENNTAPDGTAEYLENHTGYERAWLGPWEHVRGAETDDDGRLKMGRAGWYDEVMRFYDRFLRGQEPAVQDPPIAVQTNDGKWRAEQSWPPADAAQYTTTLRAGEYDDTGQSWSTGAADDSTATSGVWTISKPLPYDVHLSGAGKAIVDVETAFPRANLVVDVYDLDENGSGPLVSRQGHLIRESGPAELPLMSADWKIPAGHRIGVRVTDTNMDWWLLTLGTQQPVTVKGGTISLPFLTYKRTETIQGDPGTQLEGYLADTVNVPADVLAASESDFGLPPAMTDAPAGGGTTEEPQTPAEPNGAGTAATPSANASSNASGTPSRTRSTGASSGTALAARLRAFKGGRLQLTGTAPKGSRVVVKLRRAGRTVATKRFTLRTRAFRVTFRGLRSGRYGALVSATSGGKRLATTAKSVRVKR